MDYVHLVVPQHLYDELGLRPNQTVTLSNPQNAGEPLEDNVSVATNSEETSCRPDETSMADSGVNNNAGEAKATTSNPAEILRVVVNAENGKRKLLTYQLKSATLLSDSESESDSSIIECACSGSDDDDDTSSSVSCDAPIPENSDSGGIVERGAVQPACDSRNVFQSVSSNATLSEVTSGAPVPSRRESHAVFQGMSVNALHSEAGRVKNLNPMFCEICCRGYLSKGSFRNHRKNCEDFAKNKRTKPLYPRQCENCGRTYPDSSTFCRHKRMCEEYKEREAKRQAAESEGESQGTGTHRPRNYEKEKPVYPRNCPKCSWKCNNRNSYAYHLKTCGETKFAKNEKDTYPKTCTACNQVYFCSSTYTKHKDECSLLQQKQTNAQGLETLSHLCQMDVVESNMSVSNTYAVMDEWDKDSCAASSVEEPGKWIPYSTKTSGKMQYFVVKKTTSSQDQ